MNKCKHNWRLLKKDCFWKDKDRVYNEIYAHQFYCTKCLKLIRIKDE